MRRLLLTAVLLLAILSGFSLPVTAQGPDSRGTDLNVELKKKRTVVKPPVETDAGASEADAVARRLDEQRRAEELQRKATPTVPPPLDERVTEGIRGQQLPELPKR